MEASQLDRPVATEPARTSCPECGEDVLAVELWAGVRLVEVAEILPRFECVFCRQVAGMGHNRHSCDHCDTSGWIGEDPPAEGVVISADGRARRYYDVGEHRREGDALHRFHIHP